MQEKPATIEPWVDGAKPPSKGADALQMRPESVSYTHLEAFVEQLPDIKGRCVEKKLFVEADAERARVLARAGVDGIQVDKVPVDELEPLVRELRAIDPHVTLIAAGGVNPQNAGAYAATGVDGLATTAPFSAKPLDMSVRMRPL